MRVPAAAIAAAYTDIAHIAERKGTNERERERALREIVLSGSSGSGNQLIPVIHECDNPDASGQPKMVFSP